MSAGFFVPVVMLPRYSTFIGAGEFTTVALDVGEYSNCDLGFWRGPLLGNAGTGAGITAIFEVSDDREVWALSTASPITTADAYSNLGIALTRRWLRARVTLTEDAAHVVAVTCWAAGQLYRRKSA